MQVELCGYYRLIRNAAIHSDRDPTELTECFAKIKHYRDEAASQYETIAAAPNPPDGLTRDDFQLFIRVAQDVAWRFSQKSKPTEIQFCTALKGVVEAFRNHWKDKPARVHVAIVSYLAKTYGIAKDEAETIANQVH